MVGSEVNVLADSPNKPGKSASVAQQRPEYSKMPSHDAEHRVAREPKLSDALTADVLSSTSGEQRTDTDDRRVVEASADSIVISIKNTDAEAVIPAASVTQKPPKIGSGRLGKADSGSARKPQGNRRGGQKSVRTTDVEEPTTIGIAVIRTPSDQPEVHYKAVDQTPKPKGILKRTVRDQRDDWVEEPVEELDWDKEIKEAQRRKMAMSSKGHESNDAFGEVLKEKDAINPSALSDNNVVVDDDDDDDDEWEDVEDDDGDDVHDISAESFDQFIKEHTLRLDVELATPDVAEWIVKDPSGSVTGGSQDSFLRTPVGQTRVVDWGVEMDQLSQSEKQRMSVEIGECYTTLMTTGLLDFSILYAYTLHVFKI